MCTHHTYYYQQLIGAYVGNGALLFVVGGEHIAMAKCHGRTQHYLPVIG